jgi:lipopolysaccharide transport system permease protein
MATSRIVIEAGKENQRYWKDLWNFRGLFFFLAWRDVLVRYKQTTIGILWALLRPALTIFALSFIRMLFTKGKQEEIPVPLLIAAGTLPWQFFATSFSDASNSLISNANLVSKVYFPRLIVPASTVIVCLLDFFISFLLVLGIMCFYPVFFGWQLLFIPVFLLLAILTSLGIGVYFSALTVKFRDFRYIIPFIVQFGMFVSPVMFSSQQIYDSSLSPILKTIYSLNPMVAVIDGFRWCFFGQRMQIEIASFLISFVISLFFLILGIRTFRKMEKEFADVI